MLTVIIATDVLTAGEAATGYLNAAVGIGGVTGAIVAGALVLRRSLRRPMLLGAAVMAVGCAILGLATELVVAMAAIVLVSAGHLVLEVTGATLLQRVTTDAVRGRAVGLMMTDRHRGRGGRFVHRARPRRSVRHRSGPRRVGRRHAHRDRGGRGAHRAVDHPPAQRPRGDPRSRARAAAVRGRIERRRRTRPRATRRGADGGRRRRHPPG